MAAWRGGRSAMITRVLQDAGWYRDPYSAGTVGEWGERYREIPIVADGRPCDVHRKAGVTSPDDIRAKSCPDCFSEKGRGTTLIDLSRKATDRSGTFERTDFLSVKGVTIDSDGKLTSRIDLGTGNPDTVAAIEAVAMRGASIPVLLFASANGSDKEPEEQGYALFVDAGEIIRREGVAPFNPDGYGKGQAPACYVALSSRRISGVPGGTARARKAVEAHERMGAGLPPGKWATRARDFVPHFDHKGNFWSKPYAVHYSELRVSLYAVGLNRESWTQTSVYDLPRFVESQDWDALSL